MFLRRIVCQVILGLCIILPFNAFAGHLLSIVATAPFPATVTPSSSTTATFTVTNEASQISLTAVNESKFPSNITVQSSTCGNLMAPHQSCTVVLQLNAPATAQTISSALRMRASPSIDGVQYPFSVQVSGASSSSSFLTLVGTGSGEFEALIASSTDNGSTFTVVPDANYQNMPSNLVTLTTASCTNGPVCIAGGYYPAGGILGFSPVILVMQPDKITWKSVPVFFGRTLVESVSCTGSGNSAICVAASSGFSSGSTPNLNYSTDGGNNWTNVLLPTSSGTLGSTTAVGSGSTAVLVAAGEDTTGGTNPNAFIEESDDGGSTWYQATITGVIVGTTDGLFSSASCTGAPPNTRCAAAGSSTVTPVPNNTFLATGSYSSGTVNWELSGIIGASDFLQFYSVGCTDSGSTAFCIAAGEDINAFLPALAYTNNGGASWQQVLTFAGTQPGSGVFNGASCTGGANGICVAVGSDTSLSIPIIAQSTNNGITWTYKTIGGTTPLTNGTLSTITCVTSVNGNICSAGGSIDGQALIVTSMDNGNTWNASVLSNPSTGGFNGSGSVATLTKKFGIENVFKEVWEKTKHTFY